ncbi:hypothetical protein C8J57DRAFT_1288723 [Mycena rebaudengoi]|nr:hypothetical protein C8J57DRAFT_1288723 [Mycena rebaudengoi]
MLPLTLIFLFTFPFQVSAAAVAVGADTVSSSGFGSPSESPVTQKALSQGLTTNVPHPTPSPSFSHTSFAPFHSDGPGDPGPQNARKRFPVVAAIVLEVVAAILGLILLLSFLRCLNSYFRTPGYDRVAAILQRHGLHREMREQQHTWNPLGRRRQSNNTDFVPPPPYLSPPSYVSGPRSSTASSWLSRVSTTTSWLSRVSRTSSRSSTTSSRASDAARVPSSAGSAAAPEDPFQDKMAPDADERPLSIPQQPLSTGSDTPVHANPFLDPEGDEKADASIPHQRP